MTITLDLPRPLEREITTEADRQGVPVAEYVLRLLSSHFVPASVEGDLRTGADVVAYWEREGLIGTRPDITDSAAHAREIRARAETRDRG